MKYGHKTKAQIPNDNFKIVFFVRIFEKATSATVTTTNSIK